MQITPETITAEMPATYCVGSDRYAGKVASVSASGKSIVFEGEGGHLRTARWKASRGQRPAYRTSGRYGQIISVGVARDYRDPSF